MNIHFVTLGRSPTSRKNTGSKLRMQYGRFRTRLLVVGSTRQPDAVQQTDPTTTRPRGGHLKTAGGAKFFVPHSIQCLSILKPHSIQCKLENFAVFGSNHRGTLMFLHPLDLDPKVTNPSGGSAQPNISLSFTIFITVLHF